LKRDVTRFVMVLGMERLRVRRNSYPKIVKGTTPLGLFGHNTLASLSSVLLAYHFPPVITITNSQ